MSTPHYDDWYRAARNAIDHLESGRAFHCLREVDPVRESLDQSKKNDKATLDEINKMRQDLVFVSFPDLPQNEASKVLSEDLLNFVLSGIDLADALEKRQVYSGYGQWENERQILKESILRNSEKIGSFGVGEWISAFDKAYDPNTRPESSIHDFFTQEPKISKLTERERAVLQIILSAYENWLAVERLDIIDLVYLKQHPELLSNTSDKSQTKGPYQSQAANQAYQSNRTAVSKPSQGVIHAPLLKALADYPRLGDQLVTSEKIKLKGQSELQRPSLSNWIHYYRDELGIGFHDQVTRGRFLFQSDNGKKLAADERERINLILKSIEEEFPIDIDTDRSMIVFPARSVREAAPAPTQVNREKLSFPTPQPLAPARPVKPFQPLPPIRPAESSAPVAPAKSAPKSSFFGGGSGNAANVANDTLHFSTGHVLPGEKETSAAPAAPQETAPPKPAPSQASVSQAASPTSAFQRGGISRPSGSSLPRSPYSIRPLRNRNDDVGK